MTPSRKPIGKAIAKRSWKSTALKILKTKNGRKYCLQKIGVMIRNELSTLCTKSILGSQCLSDLSDFKWDKLLQELENSAPVLLAILREATINNRPLLNRKAIIGMCAALILKHRYYKMCLVQKIISLILYSGHSEKQVCICINSLLCNELPMVHAYMCIGIQ